MYKQQKAFTIVELIVVVAIISILWTIWFISFSENISEARDGQRKSDLAQIKSSMKLYKQQKWVYPAPWDNFSIFSWSTAVAYQWKLNEKVTLSTLDDLPLDPDLEIPYLYSVTTNRKEMQVAGTLENWDNPQAIVVWDYKTVSINVLPTIMVAAIGDLDVASDQTKFIFNGSIHNFPYDFEWSLIPTSDNTSLADLIIEANTNNFWQNTWYRTCGEIKGDGKSIGDWEYQILNSSGSLSNTWCTSM
jgi:prepilin-type N-terminal cleavage/methylation domain-containing protein